MTKAKKLLAVLMALSILFSCFVPAVAAAEYSDNGYSVSDKISHTFYKILDKLIDIIGKVLNTLMPGLNWTGRISSLKSYVPETAFMGEETFDTEVKPEAKWSMGFADASLLEGLDIQDGSYYLAGSLEAVEGRTPAEIVDDQAVNVYAISDGVSGTVVHVVLDGYGIARGDVLEIRSRLNRFAQENNIISINVSVLHQHSCIDTLGLSAPLLAALAKNPLLSLTAEDPVSLSGKNETFMNNLFTVVTAAVSRAVTSMQGGVLYYGSADISQYIHDKREPIVFDGDIHRLRFIPDDPDANEIWVCEAGMHCVTFGAAADKLSADFPYYIKQFVKDETGADLVFVEGAELAITADYETVTYSDTSLSAKPSAMGKAIGERLIAIQNDTALDPVLNIRLCEMNVRATNQILALAVREGLVNSVVAKDGLDYVIITELGYMELGNRIGILLSPGETAPEILWGGASSTEASWSSQSWDYAPLAEICGAEKLLCFGLCNDQIGYIICDNDIRSYLTENEEITAASTVSASTLAETFTALIASVK